MLSGLISVVLRGVVCPMFCGKRAIRLSSRHTSYPRRRYKSLSNRTDHKECQLATLTGPLCRLAVKTGEHYVNEKVITCLQIGQRGPEFLNRFAPKIVFLSAHYFSFYETAYATRTNVVTQTATKRRQGRMTSFQMQLLQTLHWLCPWC